MSNCEGCGKLIPDEYALCESCELRLNGTISGEPVNADDERGEPEHAPDLCSCGLHWRSNVPCAHPRVRG